MEPTYLKVTPEVCSYTMHVQSQKKGLEHTAHNFDVSAYKLNSYTQTMKGLAGI